MAAAWLLVLQEEVGVAADTRGIGGVQTLSVVGVGVDGSPAVGLARGADSERAGQGACECGRGPVDSSGVYPPGWPWF